MLSILEAVRWDLVSNGIQILMCAVILGCLIRSRLKFRRPEAHAEAGSTGPVFSQEVLLQTIRQQVEQALQRISTAVEAEGDKLQRLLGSTTLPQPSVAAPITETAEVHVPFRLRETDSEVTDQSRFAGLKGLSGLGLSPRQIADQMNLPLGEIERVLKRQSTSESGTPAATRQ
jgi:hypothetical protein